MKRIHFKRLTQEEWEKFFNYILENGNLFQIIHIEKEPYLDFDETTQLEELKISILLVEFKPSTIENPFQNMSKGGIA